MAVELARGSARAGGGAWQIEVVAYGPEAERIGIEQGVHLRTLRAAQDGPDHGSVMSWELPAVLDGAELVHVYGPATRSGGLALVLAKHRNHRSCVTTGFGEHPGPAHAVEPSELADIAIALSQTASARLTTHRPVRVLRTGVDTGFFVPASTSRNGVVVAGTISAAALERLTVTLPPGCPLTVCGSPLGAADEHDPRVVPDPDRPARRALYQGALASVHFSAELSSPDIAGFSMLESMACGTPVIAVGSPGLFAYVEDGVSGFVVDDEAELEGLVQRLTADPRLRERVGEAGRDRVRSRWDLVGAGQALLNVYGELIT